MLDETALTEPMPTLQLGEMIEFIVRTIADRAVTTQIGRRVVTLK